MLKAVNGRRSMIDAVKWAAAYFVVFIHCQFYGLFGVSVKAVARFAVPLFFLSSGFFLYNTPPEKILKRTYRILRMLAGAFLLYFCYGVATGFVGGGKDELVKYLLRFLNWKNSIKFLLFNVPYTSTHLWFLPALIYVYLIHFVFAKRRLASRYIYISSIIVLVIHLLLWQIIMLFREEPQTFWVRNFLFVGYPFVGLGMYIRENEGKLRTINIGFLILFACLGALASMLSRHFIGNKSLPVGAVVMAVSLFLFAINERFQDIKIRNADAYSTLIYILHPIVIGITDKFARTIGIPQDSRWWINLMPVIVCIASTVFSILIVRVRSMTSVKKS